MIVDEILNLKDRKIIRKTNERKLIMPAVF